jgi:hypothetical protein
MPKPVYFPIRSHCSPANRPVLWSLPFSGVHHRRNALTPCKDLGEETARANHPYWVSFGNGQKGKSRAPQAAWDIRTRFLAGQKKQTLSSGPAPSRKNSCSSGTDEPPRSNRKILVVLGRKHSGWAGADYRRRANRWRASMPRSRISSDAANESRKCVARRLNTRPGMISS